MEFTDIEFACQTLVKTEPLEHSEDEHGEDFKPSREIRINVENESCGGPVFNDLPDRDLELKDHSPYSHAFLIRNLLGLCDDTSRERGGDDDYNKDDDEDKTAPAQVTSAENMKSEHFLFQNSMCVSTK